MASQTAVDPRVDEEKLAVPPGWQRIHCEQGTYYWHSATGHSQWGYPKSHPFAALFQGQNYENVELGSARHPPTPPKAAKPKKTTGYVNLDYSSGTGVNAEAHPKGYVNLDYSSGSGVTSEPNTKPSSGVLPDKKVKMMASSAYQPVVVKEQDDSKKVKKPQEKPPEVAESVYDTPKKDGRHQSSASENVYDTPMKEKRETIYDSPSRTNDGYDHPRHKDRAGAPEGALPVVYDSPKAKSEVLYDVPSDTMGKTQDAVYDVPTEATAKPSPSVKPKPALKPKPSIPAPYKKKEAPKKPPRRSLSPEFSAVLPQPSSPKPNRPNPSAYDHLTSPKSACETESKTFEYDRLNHGQKELAPAQAPAAAPQNSQYDHIFPLQSEDQYDRLKQEPVVSESQYDHISPPMSATRKHPPPGYDRLVSVPAAISSSRSSQVPRVEKLKKAREERIRQHNYEEIGDDASVNAELDWDDTPLEQAIMEAKKRPPPVAVDRPPPPVPVDVGEGGGVYAQVDLSQRKKSREKLPDGWEFVGGADNSETYYWHVPSGKTQWDKPEPAPPARSSALLSPPPIPVKTEGASVLLEAVKSSATTEETEGGLQSKLKELREADTKFTSLNIGGSSPGIRRPMRSGAIDGIQSFEAVYIGWIQLEEQQLLPTKSTATITSCIRFLNGGQTENEDWSPVSEKKKDNVYLQLHGIMLKILQANSSSVLMTQSITGIRLFSPGKEDPQYFAFIARDRSTQRHRCHVFRCVVLGKTVAKAMEEVCARVIHERQERKMQEQREDAGHVQRKLTKFDQGLPQQQEKKTFVATYLGRTDVPRGAGIEVVRNAIDKLKACNPGQWQEVIVEVMPTNVQIIDQKTQDVVHEHRVSLVSFLGLGQDKRYCAYVISPSKDIHWCHAFASENSSGPMSRALQAACASRYESVVESQRGLAPKRAETVSHAPVPAKTEQKTAKDTLKAFFGRFRSQRKDEPSSNVSAFLYYMGSEDFRTPSSGPPSLDIKAPMRRLSSSLQSALSCEMTVTSTNVFLNDTQKRSFSRKLFPLSSIVHCEMEEKSRNVFGFVTNKDRVYVCHVFKKLGNGEINSVFKSLQSRRSSDV